MSCEKCKQDPCDCSNRLRFEIRVDLETSRNQIFIDDELFDWGVDQSSMKMAREMGPEYWKAAQIDIQRHFIESLSDFMGRKIHPLEVVKASLEGWIRK